jgi:hypothetical protein
VEPWTLRRPKTVDKNPEIIINGTTAKRKRTKTNSRDAGLDKTAQKGFQIGR